jgi:hypothetical protein
MLMMNEMRATIRPTGRWLLGLAALVLLVTGCGGDEGAVTPREGSPAGNGGAVSTDLNITVSDGAGKTDSWKLTCDPAGGTHPDPEAACAALAAKGASALPPVPEDRMCTQIFGGPQTARITGTWRGEPVNATFSRTNGCEISRWTALEAVLGKASGGSAQ